MINLIKYMFNQLKQLLIKERIQEYLFIKNLIFIALFATEIDLEG
jgi:hypothetical protein